MVFMAPVAAPVQAPFPTAGAAAAAGWWLSGGIMAANCRFAYRAVNTPGSPWGAGPANYAASKVNLNNPGTADAIDGAAFPTWAAATGWTFDATLSQYLYNNVNLASTDALIVQFSNVAGVTGALCGEYDDVPAFSWMYLQPWVAGNAVRYGWDGNVVNAAPQLAAGNLGMISNQGYRNGVANGAPVAGAWAASPCSIPFGIGGMYAQSVAAWIAFFTGNIQAGAGYSSITAVQFAAVVTAMAAL